jgi:hypothetical protein
LSFPCLSFPRLSFPCARRGDAAGQFCGAERCCLLANDDRRTHLVEPTGPAFWVKPGSPNLGTGTGGKHSLYRGMSRIRFDHVAQAKRPGLWVGPFERLPCLQCWGGRVCSFEM